MASSGGCFFRATKCKNGPAASGPNDVRLRAILRDEGRAGEWNPMLFTVNPAASPLLKWLLQVVVSLEQQNAKTGPVASGPNDV